MTDAEKAAVEKQVKAEAAELANIPKIPVSQFQPSKTGNVGRCSWCGRFTYHLVYADTFQGVDRYKGVDCCGATYV